MNRKEYDTPKGKAVFDYDDNGVGRITLECMDMLMDMVASSMWISCGERMPNESGKYWCTFGGTNLMGIDFYTTESYAKKWFDEPEEYIGWESKNVSAWMPLPEPYKESEEK